jgi:hypothetical protein
MMLPPDGRWAARLEAGNGSAVTLIARVADGRLWLPRGAAVTGPGVRVRVGLLGPAG